MPKLPGSGYYFHNYQLTLRQFSLGQVKVQFVKLGLISLGYHYITQVQVKLIMVIKGEICQVILGKVQSVSLSLVIMFGCIKLGTVWVYILLIGLGQDQLC